MNKFAQYLRQNKIRQADFADAIKSTQATVSRLENGKKQPSAELAVTIENVTDGFVRVEDWDAFSAFADRATPAQGGAA